MSYVLTRYLLVNFLINLLKHLNHYLHLTLEDFSLLGKKREKVSGIEIFQWIGEILQSNE